MIKLYRTGGKHRSAPEAKRYYFKAQDALRAGKWIKAIQYLKRSLQIKEDYLPACRDLAELYHQHGNLKDAQKYIQEALKIKPNDPVSSFIQGVIYLSKGSIRSALESFKKAEEHGELTWGLAHNLGLCYYSLKNFDLSIKFLNIAIQKDPSQPQPYLLLAQIFLMQNEEDKAKKILMRVKKMRPHDKQLDHWLSNILDPKNRPEG